MSFHDFCLYTIGELEWIFHYRNRYLHTIDHVEWERMRLHAAMTMQPHCRNRLHPETLLPFPWDQEREERDEPLPDREEALRRFEERVRLSQES